MTRKDELIVAAILLEMANGDLLDNPGREDGACGVAGGSGSKRKSEGIASSSGRSKVAKPNDLEVASENVRVEIKKQTAGRDEINYQPAPPVAAGGSGGANGQKCKAIVTPPKQGSAPTPPINPTISRFPFGVLHFITAVRLAFFSTPPNNPQLNQAENGGVSGSSNMMTYLTFDEILARLRSNPGDVKVFEMNVRLQDLLRGVLRILSATTSPPEIPSWEPLVAYEKTTRLWSWVGPVPNHYRGANVIPTSPEAWGMSRRILHEMVEWFGGWLKETSSVLEEIASLHPPPLLYQILQQERFKETRNLKKSVPTIEPTNEVMRGYFRREEALRYTIPEMTFSYIARDGRKSTVAPLRKPLKKVREHFLLKSDRPACFTIRCLVRDAAARLPNGVGTNLDICCLAMDSQFLIEDAGDEDIRKIVSGALDRLQDENDPCIKFHKDRFLWSYLHREKEEEDFNENCTIMGNERNYRN